MNEINEQTGAAIAAIINGTASDAEKEQISQWLKADPGNQKLFDLLIQRGFNVSAGNAESFRQQIYERTRVKIAKQESKRAVRLWQWTAAASVILLIGVSVLFTLKNTNQSQQIIETKCPEGSRSTITLADGTLVELNSGSSISYPSRFAGKSRNVLLKGEAFFKVVSDKSRPFIVRAGNISVRVLGTHFNVKAYDGDNKILTTLVEGSVRIEISGSSDKFFVLKPQQQAIFDRVNNKLNIKNVNAHLYSSWKEGTIYFDSENLREIARKLEREFNIKIDIQTPELEKEVFSGVFDKGESITQILDMLRKHRNFNYREREKNIELYIEK